MSALAFPNSDQVATAIVMAARFTGEDPLRCALAVGGMRCRHVAYEALKLSFPGARRKGLERCLGYRGGHPMASLSSAARSAWWSEVAVDEIVGALVGEDGGAA